MLISRSLLNWQFPFSTYLFIYLLSFSYFFLTRTYTWAARGRMLLWYKKRKKYRVSLSTGLLRTVKNVKFLLEWISVLTNHHYVTWLLCITSEKYFKYSLEKDKKSLLFLPLALPACFRVISFVVMLSLA